MPSNQTNHAEDSELIEVRQIFETFAWFGYGILILIVSTSALMSSGSAVMSVLHYCNNFLGTTSAMTLSNVLWWALLTIGGWLFYFFIGLALTEFFGRIRKDKLRAAKTAAIAGMIPFLIFGGTTCSLIFWMPPHTNLTGYLGWITVTVAPLMSILGLWMGLFQIKRTTPPMPPTPVKVRLASVELEALTELDARIAKLLTSKSVEEANAKAHDCLLLLGISTDPIGDESLTILPQQLAGIKRTSSALAITKMHMKLVDDSE